MPLLSSKKGTWFFFDIIQLCIDQIIINSAFFLSFLIRYGKIDILTILAEKPYLYFLLYSNVLWIILTHFYDAYHNKRTVTIYRVVKLNLKITIIHFFLATAFLSVHQVEYYPTKQLFITYSMIIQGVILWRVAGISFIRQMRLRGYFIEQYVVMGNEYDAKTIEKFLQEHKEFGLKGAGYIKPETIENKEKLLNILKKKRSERIFYCSYNLPQNILDTLLQLSVNHHIDVTMIPIMSQDYGTQIEISQIGKLPVMHLTHSPLEELHNRQLKRFFDVLFSVLVFIFVLSWLFPVIALLIKVTSNGPVFFLQPREGEKGQTFMCFKFRTMYLHNNIEFKQASKNDPRITPIGRLLRKTSLDELPQFINVLKGDMSIVGPRPHPIPLNEGFKNKIKDFGYRHAIKPGITGLAQAKGFRGETKKSEEMENRVKFDHYYISKWTFLLEIKVFFLTIVQLLKGDSNAF
ncbi:exopolysaccharide biosynthesis polyprenyl glycosylphosphotransferase [bacterium]|nr:exopolysaccharide biosynthesis polyprenyl glycosylphosphotransferase [bacterium]